jgi:WhiB family redox-sensing transcriptional regulator
MTARIVTAVAPDLGVDPPAWTLAAACQFVDPEIFFPEKGGSTREAKLVCGGCEVRAECLAFALAHQERFGIYGGLSERERRRLLPGFEAGRSPRRNAARCGTAAQPYPDAHFATFPPELARRCITAGCPPDGTVLDPFTGSGTTLMVARRLLRKSVGIELNPAYCELIVDRIGQPIFDFGEASA